MSGRTLRKLPVLAHARYVSGDSHASPGTDPTPFNEWLEALEQTITDTRSEMSGALNDNEPVNASFEDEISSVPSPT